MTASALDATSLMPRRRIHVIATTPDNARRALAVALPLTLDAVEYSTVIVEAPIHGDVAPEMLERWSETAALDYQKVMQDLGVDVALEVHPFRSLGELLTLISTGELVVISGPSGAWAPSPEEELANQLSDLGRRAVFVACRPIDPAATR